MSEAKLQVLSELQQIADTTKSLNTELDALLKTASPGGDLYESQQEALKSMRMWKAVATNPPDALDDTIAPK
eukprot:m.454293 g.454293  ORF g.454293 m.454293 type:complete len:72 (+) comp20644_c0_seq1:296-511(+)